MHPRWAPVVSAETTMEEYRKEYNEKQKEFLRPENREWVREQFVRVIEVVAKPQSVNMKEYIGPEEELGVAVERLYENYGS